MNRSKILPIIIYDRFVVFPFVWVGRVVHANFKVLRTREEEVAIVRKLSRVTSGVIMNDRVRIRSWDEALSIFNRHTINKYGVWKLPEKSVYCLFSLVYRPFLIL